MSPELVFAGLTILVVVGLSVWVLVLGNRLADTKVDAAEQKEKEARDHAKWTNEATKSIKNAEKPPVNDPAAPPKLWDL